MNEKNNLQLGALIMDKVLEKEQITITEEQEIEKVVFEIMGAQTVGELVDLDIPVEMMYKLIANAEFALRKIESYITMQDMLPEFVKSCKSQKQKKFIF